MIMPISFIPYPLPKPSEWLTLTPWFSKSPPSSPQTSSSSSSSSSPSPSSPPSPPKKPPPSSSSRPSPPVAILSPSPVTTTATSTQTPEMTQVRHHVNVNVNANAMIVASTFVSSSSNSNVEKARVNQASGGEDKPKSTPTKSRMKNRVEEEARKSFRPMLPRPPRRDDVVWLFDLRSARGAVPWHPNTWKVRLALNYKQIPYTTIWLTYPSMEPVLKQLGVPPMQRDRNGNVHYSVPVIIDWRAASTIAGAGENGELWAVSGSERILDYLDGAMTTRTTYTSRSRKSKSQSPPPSSSSAASSSASTSTSRSHYHPPSTSRQSWPGYHSDSNPSSSSSTSSSSSSLAHRPKLLQSMFDSMVERVLDPPFWKMILPLAWMGGVLDDESKAYFLEVRGCPVTSGSGSGSGGLAAETMDSQQTKDTKTNTNTKARMKKWNPERYVTNREWDALREGFETISAFCEMYGIGIGGVAREKSSSSVLREERQAQERDRDRNSLDSDSDSGSLVLTRVEIVLIAYLAALHECVPTEKWVEIRDTWCSGVWGALWDRSERVRVHAESL